MIKEQGQRHQGLDFTWDKDNGHLTLDRQLTLINNQLRSIIDLDKQSTWINNQIGPTITTSLRSTIDLYLQLT